MRFFENMNRRLSEIVESIIAFQYLSVIAKVDELVSVFIDINKFFEEMKFYLSIKPSWEFYWTFGSSKECLLYNFCKISFTVIISSLKIVFGSNVRNISRICIFIFFCFCYKICGFFYHLNHVLKSLICYKVSESLSFYLLSINWQ